MAFRGAVLFCIFGRIALSAEVPTPSPSAPPSAKRTRFAAPPASNSSSSALPSLAQNAAEVLPTLVPLLADGTTETVAAFEATARGAADALGLPSGKHSALVLQKVAVERSTRQLLAELMARVEDPDNDGISPSGMCRCQGMPFHLEELESCKRWLLRVDEALNPLRTGTSTSSGTILMSTSLLEVISVSYLPLSGFKPTRENLWSVLYWVASRYFSDYVLDEPADEDRRRISLLETEAAARENAALATRLIRELMEWTVDWAQNHLSTQVVRLRQASTSSNATATTTSSAATATSSATSSAGTTGTIAAAPDDHGPLYDGLRLCVTAVIAPMREKPRDFLGLVRHVEHYDLVAHGQEAPSRVDSAREILSQFSESWESSLRTLVTAMVDSLTEGGTLLHRGGFAGFLDSRSGALKLHELAKRLALPARDPSGRRCTLLHWLQSEAGHLLTGAASQATHHDATTSLSSTMVAVTGVMTWLPWIASRLFPGGARDRRSPMLDHSSNADACVRRLCDSRESALRQAFVAAQRAHQPPNGRVSYKDPLYFAYRVDRWRDPPAFAFEYMWDESSASRSTTSSEIMWNEAARGLTMHWKRLDRHRQGTDWHGKELVEVARFFVSQGVDFLLRPDTYVKYKNLFLARRIALDLRNSEFFLPGVMDLKRATFDHSVVATLESLLDLIYRAEAKRRDAAARRDNPDMLEAPESPFAEPYGHAMAHLRDFVRVWKSEDTAARHNAGGETSGETGGEKMRV